MKSEKRKVKQGRECGLRTRTPLPPRSPFPVKWLLIAAAVLLFAACAQPGDLPLTIEGTTSKGITTTWFGITQFRPIEMVCYIDTSEHSPLNALDYTLADSGVLFFDYVILGGAFIRKNAQGQYYMDLSADLRRLLARRSTHIVPLQRQGIRVLLGIESAGDASFGQLNEDKMYAFAGLIYDTLQLYGLNGVEYFDNADDEAYPRLEDYDPAADEDGLGAEYWLLEKWKDGGSNYNNFFYGLRSTFYDRSPVITVDGIVQVDIQREYRDSPPLFLRESRYGRFLPERVWATDGFADFVGSNAEITYSFNPFFDRFPSRSAQRNQSDYQESDIGSIADNIRSTWLSAQKYGPLAVNLDGDATGNIWYPFIEKAANAIDVDTEAQLLGDGIDTLFNSFRWSESQAVYFHNLKNAAVAAGDDYYRWLLYDDGKLETAFSDTTNPNYNPTYVPIEDLFSDLSLKLFNERVARSGGEHVKDW